MRWFRWKHESGGLRQSLEHRQSWVRHRASVGDSACPFLTVRLSGVCLRCRGPGFIGVSKRACLAGSSMGYTPWCIHPAAGPLWSNRRAVTKLACQKALCGISRNLPKLRLKKMCRSGVLQGWRGAQLAATPHSPIPIFKLLWHC